MKNETNKTIRRAVLYCRVSTKEQVDEGNSLSTQEKICKEYALKNEYEIARVFIEQGESAKTANRTELQKLLLFCADKKNKVTAVVAYKIDRIARNTDDYSQIRLLLKRYGIDIKSTSEYFENTPAGRFMENIISNVAQFDNDVRTERTVNGMKDAVREGRYLWKGPLGYDNVRIGNKSNIVPNYIAPFIAKAFQEIGNNQGAMEDVRKKLNEEGLLKKSGTPISKSQFYRMLRNEVYTGWINKFGERHKGIYEAIISEEVFAKVQYVLTYRRRSNTHYHVQNEDFPLRRFIIHPEGFKLTGSWSTGSTKKYAYYRYLNPGLEFKKDWLEGIFMSYLDLFRFNEQKYSKFSRFLELNLIMATKNSAEKRLQLTQYLAGLKEKRTLIIEKNIKGVINDEILKEHLEFLQCEKFKTEEALSKIPNENHSLQHAWDYVSEYLRNPGRVWIKLPLETKLKLQWFQFPKGIGFDGKKFGTDQIAHLFNVKVPLNASLSHVVTPMHYTSNYRNKTQELKIIIPARNQSCMLNQDNASEFVAAISEFSDILQGKKDCGG